MSANPIATSARAGDGRVLLAAAGLLLLLAGAGSAGEAKAGIAAALQRPAPAAGRLLIASPHLLDPNFEHTVVLLLHYDETGAAGVVLNRPSPLPLAEVLPDLDAAAGRRHRLYLGGPVAVSALLFLVRATSVPAESVPVVDEVYSIRSAEALEHLVEGGIPQEELRAYAGYAGWAPGQLDAEIARGDWLLQPGSARWVFEEDSGTLWRELLERARSPIV